MSYPDTHHHSEQHRQRQPQNILRTEVYTFPGYGEAVVCTYAGRDPDPERVKRPREAERRQRD